MSRYIDADKLELFLKTARQGLYLDRDCKDYDFHTRDLMLLNFEQYVHLMPAADVAPVMRGEWIVDECDTTDAVTSCSWIDFHCSVCGANHGLEDGQYGWCRDVEIPYNYCPICGARMGTDK